MQTIKVDMSIFKAALEVLDQRVGTKAHVELTISEIENGIAIYADDYNVSYIND